MTMRFFRLWQALLCLGMLLLPPLLYAQPGFRFDSTFHLGSHDGPVGRARFLRDSLHFDFVDYYQGPTTLYIVHHPELWESLYGGDYHDTTTYSIDGTNPSSIRFWSNGNRFPLGIVSMRYDSMRAVGLKAYYSPGETESLTRSTECTENYYGQDNIDTVRRFEFASQGTASSTTYIPKQYVSYATFNAGPCIGCDSLIAEDPRYTMYGVNQSGGNPLNNHGDSIAPGYYARISQPSSNSKLIDVTFTMSATSPTFTLPTFDADSVIAYAIIYKRDTTGQLGKMTTKRFGVPRQTDVDQCLCNYYTVIDTLKITKGLYLAGQLQGSTSFRDVTFSITFPDSTFSSSPPKGDSTIWIPITDGPQWHRDTTIGGTTVYVADTVTTIGVAPSTRTTYQPPLNGYLGWGVDSANHTYQRQFCDRMLDSLKARKLIDARTEAYPVQVNSSDLTFRLYTKRNVRIDFLRSRVSPHLLTALAANQLDTAIINPGIDSLYADSTLNAVLGRMEISDEPTLQRFRSFGLMDSKVQRRMLFHDSTGTRGVFMDPENSSSALRVTIGDLDSTAIKMIHGLMFQVYYTQH